MKKYFAKYLPVEGEINENEIKDTLVMTPKGLATFELRVHKDLDTPTNKIRVHNGKTFVDFFNSEVKLVKLFLCSRHTECPSCGEKENLHDNLDYSKEELPVIETLCNECGTFFDYKKIGEISPEAIWVKEGDEFNENDIQPTTKIYGWEDEKGVEEKFKKFIQKGKGYISYSILSRDKYKDAPPEIYFSVKTEPYQIKCSQCKTYH